MIRPPEILRHALADDALRILRDRDTPPTAFRAALRRLTLLLAAEASRDLPTTGCRVNTPLQQTDARALGCRVGVVPILRAGLGMVDPMLELIPEAEVWHLGFYRDEKTLQPVAYYQKLPAGRPVAVAFVLDPMLATGGSAIAAIRDLHAWGVSDIRFLGILGAPEGLARIQTEYPTVRVHLCALDERLNANGYILPGLGDAGDRTFNATPAHPPTPSP